MERSLLVQALLHLAINPKYAANALQQYTLNAMHGNSYLNMKLVLEKMNCQNRVYTEPGGMVVVVDFLRVQ